MQRLLKKLAVLDLILLYVQLDNFESTAVE